MEFYDLEGKVSKGTYGDLASISNPIINWLCDFGPSSLLRDIFQAKAELLTSANPPT